MKKLLMIVVLVVLALGTLAIATPTAAQDSSPIWGVQVNRVDVESTITHLPTGQQWTLPLVVFSSVENNSTENAILVGGPDKWTESYISFYIHVDMKNALKGPDPKLSQFFWWNDSVIYHSWDGYFENSEIGILSNLQFHEGLVADAGDDTQNIVVTVDYESNRPAVWVEDSARSGYVAWTPVQPRQVEWSTKFAW